MADKLYCKGLRGFKPHEKSPDFVLGSVVITLKEFSDFLKSKEVEPYFTIYKEQKQIKLSVLRAKDGGLSFTVDTYKKGEDKKESEDIFNE